MTLALYDYQKKGVEFLLSKPFNQPHALLADEPGTGKTVMAIEAAKQTNCKTGIILCPKSIKLQWAKQMEAWGLASPDEIQICEGYSYKLDNRPWVILNYALVRQEEIRKQLFERNWHTLVEDEAHNLKTHLSRQTKAVFHKSYGIANKCYWKWPLSGSIMPNRPIELYPILRTHFPQVIQDCLEYQVYINKFCGGGFKGGRGASNIDELTERLQKVMLLRALKDVWREMPPVVENVVWLDVPFENHPEWEGSEFMPDAKIRRCVAEAKVPHIVAYVEDRLNSGLDKITVFTYHREVTEGIAKGLAKYHPQKIYGGISSKLREGSLTKFQSESHSRVLILQIMSAGEGLDGIQNVCAEYVLAEPEWSPGREDQARRRIMRLGQQKTVIETKLYAARSYEEVVYLANLRKRGWIDVVLTPNGGNFMGAHFEQSLEKLAATVEKLEAGLAPVLQMLATAVGNGIALREQANSLEAQANQQVQQPSPFQAAQPAAVPSTQAHATIPASTHADIPATAALAASAAIASQPIVTAPAGNVVPFAQAAAASPAQAASQNSGTTAGGVAGFPTRGEFEKAVLAKARALPPGAGVKALQAACGAFNIAKLGDLPDEFCTQFMAVFEQHALVG